MRKALLYIESQIRLLHPVYTVEGEVFGGLRFIGFWVPYFNLTNILIRLYYSVQMFLQSGWICYASHYVHESTYTSLPSVISLPKIGRHLTYTFTHSLYIAIVSKAEVHAWSLKYNNIIIRIVYTYLRFEAMSAAACDLNVPEPSCH